MRMPFLLLAFGFSLNLSAQELDKPYVKLLEKIKSNTTIPLLPLEAPDIPNRVFVEVPRENQVRTSPEPSAPGIYTLPLDNMPCVVPDVVYNMNVARETLIKPDAAGAIPNASPGKIILKKSSRDIRPSVK